MEVAAMVPRVRRRIEGVVPPASPLTDEQVEALAADAIAEIIFFTAGFWGHTLIADDGPPPEHWSIAPDLDEAEQTVVVVQAALDWFFHEFKDIKIQETISREGASWSYSQSANLVNQQLDMLRKDRDAALAIIGAQHPVVARYGSFIEARDRRTAAVLEPYVDGGQGGEFQRGGRGGLELAR